MREDSATPERGREVVSKYWNSNGEWVYCYDYCAANGDRFYCIGNSIDECHVQRNHWMVKRWMEKQNKEQAK